MSDREPLFERRLVKLVTVPEAARYLGVGRKMVYQLLEWGEIDAVRHKSRVKISQASIERFKASGRMI